MEGKRGLNTGGKLAGKVKKDPNGYHYRKNMSLFILEKNGGEGNRGGKTYIRKKRKFKAH